MDTEIFSVYDSAAKRYLDPFVAPTVEMALRGFRSAVNKAGHQFNEYPSDYTLFHIGSFSAERGEVVPLAPHSLGVAITFLSEGGSGA